MEECDQTLLQRLFRPTETAARCHACEYTITGQDVPGLLARQQQYFNDREVAITAGQCGISATDPESNRKLIYMLDRLLEKRVIVNQTPEQ